jgi:hypothetical protein
MYSEFVEPWTSVFPKEQILFMRSEDYQVGGGSCMVAAW